MNNNETHTKIQDTLKAIKDVESELFPIYDAESPQTPQSVLDRKVELESEHDTLHNTLDSLYESVE